MKLYNTLTKQIDSIEKMDGSMHIFVCGPTVYDYSHIGHAKTYIQFDALIRTLRYFDYDVTYLQNITDIDDKIIARAQETNKPWHDISQEFEAEYLEDMKQLKNTSVDTYARATDHIADIISQVQQLLKKNHAYVIDKDGIYFEIDTFEEYGKLSGRTDIKQHDSQSRIDQSDQKRGWNDFCLWKFSKPDEPTWDAPFGAGRPGWHIEDTAITEHFFGPQYDLHGGAVDLIFPHHEAEITQMEAASGVKPFVKHWVHTGFLMIDGEKMSKSLGNFYTIKDVLTKGYDIDALRLFMLQTHYRSEINFTFAQLDATQTRFRRWLSVLDLLWQPVERTVHNSDISAIQDSITSSLRNDFNTPQAIAEFEQLIKHIDTYGVTAKEKDAISATIQTISAPLGVSLATTDISSDVKKLLAERQSAREDKDFDTADAIRDQLASEHQISVKDKNDRQIWQRVRT